MYLKKTKELYLRYNWQCRWGGRPVWALWWRTGRGWGSRQDRPPSHRDWLHTWRSNCRRPTSAEVPVCTDCSANPRLERANDTVPLDSTRPAQTVMITRRHWPTRPLCNNTPPHHLRSKINEENSGSIAIENLRVAKLLWLDCAFSKECEKTLFEQLVIFQTTTNNCFNTLWAYPYF